MAALFPLETRDPRQRLASLRGGPPRPATSAPVVPTVADPDGAQAFAAYLDELQRTGHDPLGLAELDRPMAGGASPAPDPPPAVDDLATEAVTAVSAGTGQPADAPGSANRAAAGDGRAGRLVRRWLPPDTAGWRFDPGRRPAVALAAVVLLAAVVAGVLVWRSRPVPEPAPALAAAVQDGRPAGESVDLVVSIAGLVAKPGLVRLAPGARVADAVAAAGGPVPGTDLTGVNLARRLTDGEHVVIGPAPAAAGTPDTGASAGSGSRLDLNTATLAELDGLPGVGPVTAQRILDWRAEHGRFASVEQLREIDGIGETRYARLKDLVLA